MSTVDADLDFIFNFISKPRVKHSRVNLWRAELAERVWRQRVIVKRCGFPGTDWDQLIKEIEEFRYCEEGMAGELARRREKAGAS